MKSFFGAGGFEDIFCFAELSTDNDMRINLNLSFSLVDGEREITIDYCNGFINAFPDFAVGSSVSQVQCTGKLKAYSLSTNGD